MEWHTTIMSSSAGSILHMIEGVLVYVCVYIYIFVCVCVCVLISHAAWGQSNLSVNSQRIISFIWHLFGLSLSSASREITHTVLIGFVTKTAPASMTYFFNLFSRIFRNDSLHDTGFQSPPQRHCDKLMISRISPDQKWKLTDDNHSAPFAYWKRKQVEFKADRFWRPEFGF